MEGADGAGPSGKCRRVGYHGRVNQSPSRSASTRQTSVAVKMPASSPCSRTMTALICRSAMMLTTRTRGSLISAAKARVGRISLTSSSSSLLMRWAGRVKRSMSLREMTDSTRVPSMTGKWRISSLSIIALASVRVASMAMVRGERVMTSPRVRVRLLVMLFIPDRATCSVMVCLAFRAAFGDVGTTGSSRVAGLWVLSANLGFEGLDFVIRHGGELAQPTAGSGVVTAGMGFQDADTVQAAQIAQRGAVHDRLVAAQAGTGVRQGVQVMFAT